MDFKKVLPFILLILALIVLSYPSLVEVYKQDQNVRHQELMQKSDNLQPVSEKYNVDMNEIEINVNYPPSLSYKSKTDIYNMRKRYVRESIFSSPNYEPSEYVFGQIVSWKPWMTLNICEDSEATSRGIKGPSEEGRFIANPTMLVAIEYPFYIDNPNDYEWCNGQEASMVPKRISYSPNRKEITVVYRSLPIYIVNNSFYVFNGVNARDFGYKYVYVDTKKSTYKPEFTNSENASNRVVQFQNFIHLGSSCGVDGGCNNGSPRQPMLEFKYKDKDYTKKNVEIYLKLWHKQPKSPKDKPDITEKIIIERL